VLSQENTVSVWKLVAPEGKADNSFMDSQIDVRTVRALLAAERITHTTYAAACGMSRRYVLRLLVGSERPGELARIKLARGLAVLGLDRQDADA
jgi:hypothetical protein